MIRLGLNVPNFGPTVDPDNLRRWARFAEEHGFAVAMVSDHVTPTPDVAAIYPPPFYDPFVTLAWLAGHTERLELGTTVAIVPYRHPLLTARLTANIDQFSGGRLVLGVGVGWSEAEYAAFGIPFRERGRITDEFLGAILDAWTHDTVSLDGDYARYVDVSTRPRPVRRPHPPLWVGGNSAAAIRRAARFATAWHPANPDLTWLTEAAIPSLRSAAAAAGRPVPGVVPRIKAHLTPRPVSADRPLGRGSLEQIREDIAALARLGCSYVVVDTNPDHPKDRRTAEEDWHTLAQIAAAVSDLTTGSGQEGDTVATG